jgi:hypothetical protein
LKSVILNLRKNADQCSIVFGRRIDNCPVFRLCLVNHQQRIAERGAVLGVALAIDRNHGAHIVLGADLLPPAFERGLVHRHAFAHDGHQSAAIFQPLQGLFDVLRAQLGIALAFEAPGGRAKRGVHHHHGRAHIGGQDVVQLLGVFMEHPGRGEHLLQHRRAPAR